MRLKLCLLLLCGMVAASSTALAQTKAPRLKGYFGVKPAPGITPDVLASPNVTLHLPTFPYQIVSDRDGKTYSGAMVGSSPFSGGAGQTNVPTQIVSLIIKLHLVGTSVSSTGMVTTAAGNTTLNPTVINPCLTAPNNIPSKVFRQSPLFNNANFNYGGTPVGITQATDAYQRANFWNNINRSMYHTRLSTITVLPAMTVDIAAPNGLALDVNSLGPPPFCQRLGIVDVNVLDSILTTTVIPALAAQGVNASTFPIFLLSNVVMSVGNPNNLNNCCILGYHGANGMQTYSPQDFESTGLFGPTILNTAIGSHEIAEWMDDPFGNNATPAWGHTGQVTGCQNNLENGDPLTGTLAPRIHMPNGFTYNLQELAFFAWFFTSSSNAVNGWDSDNGTFLSDAGPPCT